MPLAEETYQKRIRDMSKEELDIFIKSIQRPKPTQMTFDFEKLPDSDESGLERDRR